MATDAQGRLLSDDGNYFWDGSDWQLVDTAAGASSQQVDTGSTDAQGRLLSDDGNYFWDGSDWQLIHGEMPDSDGVTAEQIDTSGLVETLNTIAEIDETAVASTSSLDLDNWIESLSQWQAHLSQSQYEA